jgi:hypothetical protein
MMDRIDTRSLRSGLLFPDREEGPAEAGMDDAVDRSQSKKNEKKDEIVVIDLPTETVGEDLWGRDSRNPKRTAGESLQVDHQKDEDNIKTQCRKGQENPGESEGGFANQISEEGGNHSGQGQSEDKRDSKAEGEKSRTVSSNPIERGMADGEETCIAIDEVKTEGKDSVDADEDENPEIVGVLYE